MGEGEARNCSSSPAASRERIRGEGEIEFRK